MKYMYTYAYFGNECQSVICHYFKMKRARSKEQGARSNVYSYSFDVKMTLRESVESTREND